MFEIGPGVKKLEGTMILDNQVAIKVPEEKEVSVPIQTQKEPVFVTKAGSLIYLKTNEPCCGADPNVLLQPWTTTRLLD